MCHFLFIVLNVIIIATISSSYMNRRTIFIHIEQPQDDIYILLYSHRMIFIHYCTVTGRYLYIIVQPQDDNYILLYSHRMILYIIVQPQDDIYTLLYSHRTIFIYYCTATGWIYTLLYSHRTIFIYYYTAKGRYLWVYILMRWE